MDCGYQAADSDRRSSCCFSQFQASSCVVGGPTCSIIPLGQRRRCSCSRRLRLMVNPLCTICPSTLKWYLQALGLGMIRIPLPLRVCGGCSAWVNWSRLRGGVFRCWARVRISPISPGLSLSCACEHRLERTGIDRTRKAKHLGAFPARLLESRLPGPSFVYCRRAQVRGVLIGVENWPNSTLRTIRSSVIGVDILDESTSGEAAALT